MRSRTLQPHVLVLVVLALAALIAGEAGADAAARDKWVSDDGTLTLSVFKGDVWVAEWSDNAKKQAAIILLNVIKTTDAEKVFEQGTKGGPPITVTLGAKEAVIETKEVGFPTGKFKGSWK